MKTLVVIFLAFAFRFECYSSDERGDPFAPYKEQGYSLKEAVDVISIDSILVLEYRNLFQQFAEKDGWIKSIKGEFLSLENTVYLIQNLNVQDESWNSGEVIVRSRKGNKFFNLDRPSWSDRKNKVLGKEPVGVLDVTKTLGLWNGDNSYPVRIVMIMRCLNSVYDTRYQILPVAPLIDVISDDGEHTVFYAVHDTVWIQGNSDNYITNNYYNNENNCNDCESYYTSPVYEPSCGSGFSFGMSFGFGYSSFPSYPSYVYQGGNYYNYYSYDYDYNYYNYQYYEPTDPGGPGGAPGIGPGGGPGGAGGIGPDPDDPGGPGGTGGIGPGGGPGGGLGIGPDNDSDDPSDPARGSYNSFDGGGKSSTVSQRNSTVQNIKNNSSRNSSSSYSQPSRSSTNSQAQRSSSNSYSQPSRSSNSYSQSSRNSSVAQNNKKSNHYSQPSRSNTNSQPSRHSNSYSQRSSNNHGSYSNPGRSNNMVSRGGNSFGGGRPSSGGGGGNRSSSSRGR